jgi:hypothetical protein
VQRASFTRQIEEYKGQKPKKSYSPVLTVLALKHETVPIIKYFALTEHESKRGGKIGVLGFMK